MTIHDPVGPIAQGREILREAIYLQELEACKAAGVAHEPNCQPDIASISSPQQQPQKINLLDIKVNMAMQRASNDVQHHEDSVDQEIYLEEINKASESEARRKS